MSKGPTPAPTALKLLKGVRPARINREEPKPKSVSGDLPAGWSAEMSEEAVGFWERYAPVLSNLGVLTEADLPAFRVLSELWARWLGCAKAQLDADLEPKDALAYMRVANNVETQMLRYLQEFGMTASSRGKIVVVGQSDDEDEGFLD